MDRLFQKRDAKKAMRHIRGVRSVLNYITVAPRAVERDVRHRIVAALHRNGQHRRCSYHRDSGGRHSHGDWQRGELVQRDAAERAAADAPGITHVENRIVVEPRSLEAVPDDTC